MAERRVGVLGTLVCDDIYGPPPDITRSEGWGGIAYALSGLGAALDDHWDIVLFIKVGADVVADARRWTSTIPRMAAHADLASADAPNNRSELRYVTTEVRTERMSGGVPGWTFAELRDALDAAQLDALYVNFLSGTEVDLPTMQRVRAHFAGPIYVDLHMMLWETDAQGRRALRPLTDALAWCACFDFIQLNEDEMRTIAPDPDALNVVATRAGAAATFVTLGSRGVHYHVRPAHPRWPAVDDMRPVRSTIDYERIITGVQPPQPVRVGVPVDPTGCGDVWGGTVFARMLAGDAPHVAMSAANRAASLNAESQGVTGLVDRLLTLRRTDARAL